MKQFLGCSIVMHMFLFFACIMMCPSLLCMEDVMIHHVIAKDDYDTQRTFAVINKTYNKLIEDNRRPDKKRIECWMQKNNIPVIPMQISWNKDFTKCSWMGTRRGFLRKKLEITLLGISGKDVIMKKKVWDDYVSPVIKEIDRPFFDKRGDMVYFHGCGYITTPYRNTMAYNGYYFEVPPLKYSCDKAIVEYSLCFNGEAKSKGCYFSLEKADYVYCFSYLLNFPALLKAFFNSINVDEYVDNSVLVKRYALTGVIIPDDYTSCKKHSLAHYEDYESYDELGGIIQKAVGGRYAEQQREKKMIDIK